MGKMAKQQKYAKAHSNVLKAMTRVERLPGENSTEKFNSAASHLKSVTTPNMRSKNWGN